MQFSPVLVAFLAATATVGVSSSARGESTESLPSPKPATSTLNYSGTQSQKSAGVLLANGVSSPEVMRMQPQAIAQVVSQQDTVPDEPSVPIFEVPTTPQPNVPSTPTPETLTEPAPPVVDPAETPQPVEPVTPTDEAPTAPAEEAPAAPAEETPTTPTDEAPAEETPTAPTDETPTAPTDGAPAEETPAEEQPPQAEEPRVLVAEVVVEDPEGKLTDQLRDEVYRVIQTRPGQVTTRSQLQEDINAIFKTGYFFNVEAQPVDTPLGVRVTFQVRVNPVLQKVELRGTKVLPESVVQEAFASQYGSVLNLNTLDEGIKRINKWYQDNGYVLAQVLDSPQVSPEGVVILEVAEGEIEDIEVRFLNKEGEATDDKGNPIRGRTRNFIVTREFQQKPGDVFNRNVAERDLQRAFGLNIFEDIRLSLNPGKDPRKVVVVANVVERNTGNIALGAGISSASGLFGTVSYQQQNFGGNNQRLGVEFQLGERDLLFDLSFTDPWIAGDPFRTSYTVNFFKRRSISLIFDGGDPEITLPDPDEPGDLNAGDRPRVHRTGGSLTFSRPLTNDVFSRPEWTASLGLQYQRVAIRDDDGDVSPVDAAGNDLSFSGEGKDDLLSVQFGIVQDRRDNPLRPTSGSLLRLGTEQTIPIGLGNVFFNRLRASYSFYLPARFINFTRECRDPKSTGAQCPQAFAFNVQGGTVLGDLPPYEAFSLGGSNSVRGYDDGDLAAARSYVQATIEYRFPVFSFISGAVFVDAATDFGSQDSVRGEPGSARNKPGSGFGYGLGVRIQSPVGPIRIDYGFNDEGDSRLHFGIGERF